MRPGHHELRAHETRAEPDQRLRQPARPRRRRSRGILDESAGRARQHARRRAPISAAKTTPTRTRSKSQRPPTGVARQRELQHDAPRRRSRHDRRELPRRRPAGPRRLGEHDEHDVEVRKVHGRPERPRSTRQRGVGAHAPADEKPAADICRPDPTSRRRSPTLTSAALGTYSTRSGGSADPACDDSARAGALEEHRGGGLCDRSATAPARRAAAAVDDAADDARGLSITAMSVCDAVVGPARRW